MAALTENLNISVVGSANVIQVACNATDVFYRGACVFIDTGTGGCQVTEAAGDTIAGLCDHYISATAGDYISIIVSGLVWVPSPSALAATDTNLMLHMPTATATDNLTSEGDSTASEAPQANDMSIGRIMDWNATNTLVRLEPMKLYSATLGWV